MAEANGEGSNSSQAKSSKTKRNVKKADKSKKVLSYLFQRNGLSEKGIPIQADGFVNVDDILDVFPDYTEEELCEATSVGAFGLCRQCAQTGAMQIKIMDQSTKSTAECNQGEVKCCQPAESPASQQNPALPVHQGADMVQKPGVTRISKYLSFLLRHGAEKEGFNLQAGGFLYVDEILQRRKASGWSVQDVQRVVATNDKQRFHVEPHPDNGRLRIRANQGHSMAVQDLVLRPITSTEEFVTVVHGTYMKNWNNIKHQGLSRMNRLHIHFAPGEPGESGVISGMRNSCEVLIYIHLGNALKDGLQFFLSANNVILSPGDADGFLKPKYFSSAFRRSPRLCLL